MEKIHKKVYPGDVYRITIGDVVFEIKSNTFAEFLLSYDDDDIFLHLKSIDYDCPR